MPELVVNPKRVDSPFPAQPYPFLLARQTVRTCWSWGEVYVTTGATFLRDKPKFKEKLQAFLEFVADDTLIIHNASFDMGFLNSELAYCEATAIPPDRVIDTLMLARKAHPMGPNSLDALCRRYGVDNSRRTKHGALLDAELLAEVYLHLIGGRQTVLGFQPSSTKNKTILDRKSTRLNSSH